MNARDVMTGQVLSVTSDVTVQQIAKILMDNAISGVPVVDNEGFPIGMVTESDLIALDANGERQAGREWWLSHLADGEPLSPQLLAYLDRAQRTARDVMASPVMTIPETTDLPEIARLLISHRIKRLPVCRWSGMGGWWASSAAPIWFTRWPRPPPSRRPWPVAKGDCRKRSAASRSISSGLIHRRPLSPKRLSLPVRWVRPIASASWWKSLAINRRTSMTRRDAPQWSGARPWSRV
jgi:hypothetical protein